MNSAEKRELYREILLSLESVVEGLEDPIAAMASSACVLHERIP